MSKPQQPEIARSRKTPAQDPDSAAAVIEGSPHPGEDAPRGAVPPENQPGHHPPKEQDKPDLDAFAARLGTADDAAPPRSGPAEPGAGRAEVQRRAVGRPTLRQALTAFLGTVAVLLLGRVVRRRLVAA